MNYPVSRTALLIVDAYNDFLSDAGKLWPKIKVVAESNGLIANLRALAATARRLGVVIVYVPHRCWHEGDYDGWRFPTPSQMARDRAAAFADGTWGGDWYHEIAPQPGDVVAEQHWGQNGFTNTDLDLQLKQRGIEKIIVTGLLANGCVEATARYGSELGYHVTLIPDATAACSREAMRAAHSINGPAFAHAILMTDAVVAALTNS